MSRLKEEQAKIDTAVEALEEKVKVASEMRGETEGRGELVTQQLNLSEEVGVLRKELEGYKDNDPGEVDRKRKEIVGFRAMAERWTDNIGILERMLLEMMGGDREGVDGVKREVYGDEYVEGEGLKDL